MNARSLILIPVFLAEAAIAADGAAAEPPGAPAAAAVGMRPSGADSAVARTGPQAQPVAGTSGAGTAGPEPARIGKLPAHEPWERWLNLPLTVAWYLPDLALQGAGAAIGYVDDKKLIPRIHRILVSEDGTRSVLPVFTVQAGGGITFRKRGLVTPESRFSLTGTAGEDWRHEAALAFRRLGLPGGLETDVALGYRLLTEEIYFGIGPRTREGAASDYSILQTDARWTVAAFRTRRASLEIKAGVRRDEVIAGRDDDYPSITELYDEASAPGLSEPSVLAMGGLDLRLDSHDGPDPRRGGEILLSASLHNEAADLPFAFAGFGIRASRLVPVAYGRALYFRLSAEKTLPLPGRDIPFYALPEIGRDGTVRGYTRGRFRDRDAAYGTVEYRWPVWTPHFKRALEFLLFADAGQVARSLPDDLDADLFQAGYGAGVRYYGREGLITRLEVGASGERVRAYFSLN